MKIRLVISLFTALLLAVSCVTKEKKSLNDSKQQNDSAQSEMNRAFGNL